MKMSDKITETIRRIIEESDAKMAQIKRNELAMMIGCVPSQINYVIDSRFTPEQGYLVESRRGGGGYIRITRIQMDKGSALMHLINSIGESVDGVTAQVIVRNLFYQQVISKEAAQLLDAALSENCYREITPVKRGVIRAAVLKNMLLNLI